MEPSELESEEESSDAKEEKFFSTSSFCFIISVVLFLDLMIWTKLRTSAAVEIYAKAFNFQMASKIRHPSL